MVSCSARLRLTLILGLLLAAPAAADDVDGPDCGRVIHDFGDAPEGIPFHAGPDIGHFPTCLAPGAAGTQEFTCPMRGTPPGTTGYMKHVQSGAANYWLGCYGTPPNLSGIDSDADGKVSSGAAASVCNSSVLTDCALKTFGGTFGQDECRFDGDAIVFTDFLVSCGENTTQFFTANCGPLRTVYLNVLVDMNFDGDWNDNGPCFDPRSIACSNVPGAPGEPCAHEWAVKNARVPLPSGCDQLSSPPFCVGIAEGAAWMRVSLTDEPVDDDFPWAGSANRPGGAYAGGETEDVVTSIIALPLSVRAPTWGQLKTIYR